MLIIHLSIERLLTFVNILETEDLDPYCSYKTGEGENQQY
jgi:hypothetical protein